MSEHIEWQQLHELLKELAQKEYGDKYGEQIFWYFQDVIDDSCKLDVLEEENKRLNNIINELEKELFIKKEFYERELTKRPKNDSEYNTRYADNCALAQICVIYDKLQKLKGSDKE